MEWPNETSCANEKVRRLNEFFLVVFFFCSLPKFRMKFLLTTVHSLRTNECRSCSIILRICCLFCPFRLLTLSILCASYRSLITVVQSLNNASHAQDTNARCRRQWFAFRAMTKFDNSKSGRSCAQNNKSSSNENNSFPASQRRRRLSRWCRWKCTHSWQSYSWLVIDVASFLLWSLLSTNQFLAHEWMYSFISCEQIASRIKMSVKNKQNSPCFSVTHSYDWKRLISIGVALSTTFFGDSFIFSSFVSILNTKPTSFSTFWWNKKHKKERRLRILFGKKLFFEFFSFLWSF